MAAEQPQIREQTYYDVLGLPVSPSQISLREIKAAYHRALLTAHPDKVSGSSGAEVDLVREAWRVLSNDVMRKEYDAKIKSRSIYKNAFVSVDLDDMTFHDETATYAFPCRCGSGGGFAITESDLEKGRDLVECRGCSSWIRVSYEIVAD